MTAQVSSVSPLLKGKKNGYSERDGQEQKVRAVTPPPAGVFIGDSAHERVTDCIEKAHEQEHQRHI